LTTLGSTILFILVWLALWILHFLFWLISLCKI